MSRGKTGARGSVFDRLGGRLGARPQAPATQYQESKLPTVCEQYYEEDEDEAYDQDDEEAEQWDDEEGGEEEEYYDGDAAIFGGAYGACGGSGKQAYYGENPAPPAEDPGFFTYRAAIGTKRGAAPESDHDTDSVASSTHGPQMKAKRKAGVSPLNRRRSLRLAEKQSQHPREQFNFSKQKTLCLERMETGRRWGTYRGETRRMLKKDDTILVPGLTKEDTIQLVNQGASSSNVPPQLLSRQTTTTALRAQLAQTGLGSIHPQAADEVDGGLFDTADRQTGSGKMKRKATVLQSPTGLMPAIKSQRRGLQKKVTMFAHDEDQRAPSGLKRRGTVEVTDQELTHKSKKPRMVRRHTTVAGVGAVYVPPREHWPLGLDAQVVWTVPLKRSNQTAVHSLAVYVDSLQCIIGNEDGTVIVLDQTVTPVQKYVVPSGVKCVLPDNDSVLACCNDGALYGIVDGEPKVLCAIKGFGQIFRMCCHGDYIALSDQHGHVAVVSRSGDLYWKKKSKGEFGWMVLMDDTGVYHGHSKGLTKYSLLDGKVLWTAITANSVLDGDQTSDHVFIACGSEIIQFSKSRGLQLLTYSRKGKVSTGMVHCCAVGCGVVFAGGNKLLGYDMDSGELVYQMVLPVKPHALQYFAGRLFCLGPGRLVVMDMTQNTITQALAGCDLETVEVSPDPAQPTHTLLRRRPTLKNCRSSSKSALSPPKARRGQLKVKAR